MHKKRKSKKKKLISNKVRGWKKNRRENQRKFFKDFYFEEMENQSKDFSVTCARYGYRNHFDNDLLHRTYQIKNNFDDQVGKPDFFATNICQDRVNLSEEIIFTIDGEDAKDFDDAVSLRKKSGRYHLGVHIADVSHFIKENSPLDKEALRRGNSVYLIDKVIPMFPEPISNHVCSLVEGEYRLTYSCFVEINSQGDIHDFTFKKSLIKSIRRLTYNQVEEVLTGRKSISPQIDKTLTLMEELKTLLRDRRTAQGAINFITYTQSFQLDQEVIKRVSLKKPLSSENLIEEFMLVANICAARVLVKLGAGIFRVHDLPRDEKLFSFQQMLIKMGYRLPKSGTLNPLQSKGMNRYMIFLDGITNPHMRDIFSFLLLVSMCQAEYSIDNIGHYGLAFKNYTHFTSPIRRYPDLAVHRLITHYYETQGKTSVPFSKKKKNPLKELKQKLKKVAGLSSENERKAVDAEREYTKVKSMRYLQQYPDTKEMETMIIKVNENGMFVKELETGIEGFVSVYDLEPDLFFDPVHEEFKRKKEVIYTLGSKITVKISHLNFKKLFIDFKPI